MTDYLWTLLMLATCALSIYTFWHDTYPALRAEHRARQESRLKWDGIAPPWYLCWAYWFGVERLFWGRKMYDPDERMAQYLRREFD